MAGLIKSQVIALVDGDPNSIEILNENHGFSLAKLINSTTKWVYDATKPIGSRWVIDGLNNYELAVANGFEGTYEEWEITQHGNDGKSKYVSYLETTTDNPPLSEQEWSASFKFTETDPVFQAWINSNPLNGLITLNDIPDATQIVRGFVNIGTQSFKGNKTIIGESTTIGNALEILNSSGTSLVKFGNNGNIGIGITPSSYKLHVNGAIYCSYISGGGAVLLGTHGVYVDNPDIGKYSFGSTTSLGARPLLLKSGDSTKTDGYISYYTSGLERLRVTGDGNVGIGVVVPEYKLDVAGHLRVDGNYVIQIKSTSSDYLVLSKSGTLDGGIYSGVGNLILQNNLRNVTIGGATATAKLSVISSSSTTGNIFDLKNSASFPIATFKNDRTIEFGDSTNINYSQFLKVHGYMNATRYYIGGSNTYFASDGVGARFEGGYLLVSGSSNGALIAGTNKSVFGFTNSAATPLSEMLNVYGNIKIGGTANGILMYTPDGSHQYKLSIDNNGLPVTTLIS